MREGYEDLGDLSSRVCLSVYLFLQVSLLYGQLKMRRLTSSPCVLLDPKISRYLAGSFPVFAKLLMVARGKREATCIPDVDGFDLGLARRSQSENYNGYAGSESNFSGCRLAVPIGGHN